MKDIDWFIDLTKDQQEKTKYIFLYQDEFDEDSWRSYCDILGVPYSTFQLRVQVCGVKANEDL